MQTTKLAYNLKRKEKILNRSRDLIVVFKKILYESANNHPNILSHKRCDMIHCNFHSHIEMQKKSN